MRQWLSDVGEMKEMVGDIRKAMVRAAEGYDRTNERVNASDAERFCDKGDYYCPRCEKPVYTKKGMMVIDHFSHYPGTFAECEAWEPEAVTHLLMKDTARSLFATPYVNIRVEERVGNLWPDLLITLGNGERIAVECQHSRISESAIERRTKGLKKHVDHVVWIYSTGNFNQRDDEFSFDEDSRHIEFNNERLDSVDFWGGSYIVLSKDARVIDYRNPKSPNIPDLLY